MCKKIGVVLITVELSHDEERALLKYRDQYVDSCEIQTDQNGNHYFIHNEMVIYLRDIKV